jgi:hypothetical protein
MSRFTPRPPGHPQGQKARVALMLSARPAARQDPDRAWTHRSSPSPSPVGPHRSPSSTPNVGIRPRPCTPTTTSRSTSSKMATSPYADPMSSSSRTSWCSTLAPSYGTSSRLVDSGLALLAQAKAAR